MRIFASKIVPILLFWYYAIMLFYLSAILPRKEIIWCRTNMFCAEWGTFCAEQKLANTYARKWTLIYITITNIVLRKMDTQNIYRSAQTFDRSEHKFDRFAQNGYVLLRAKTYAIFRAQVLGLCGTNIAADTVKNLTMSLKDGRRLRMRNKRGKRSKRS